MSNVNEIEKDMTAGFQTNTIKNKIVFGIKIATEQLGVKLTNGEWIGEGSACALGCMLLAANQGSDIRDDDQGKYEEMAADMLGVDSDWVGAFISGFDAEYRDINRHDKEAYDLGTALRFEFKVDETKLEEEAEEEEEEDDDFDAGECDCEGCLSGIEED